MDRRKREALVRLSALTLRKNPRPGAKCEPPTVENPRELVAGSRNCHREAGTLVALAVVMTVSPRIGVSIACALLVVVWSTAANGQSTGVKNPPLVINSMYGRDLYGFYCASCHGPRGRGDGPMATALKVAPADLATLADRHGGTFPAAYVEQIIVSGGTIASRAHGSTDMPVWGPIFVGLENDNARVKVRVSNLVAHLETLQTR